MTEHERSTGKTHRVDVSPAVEAAFAARAPLSEDELFRAYGTVGPVTDPCQCGGDITADPLCPSLEVQEHNETPLHLAWRMQQ